MHPLLQKAQILVDIFNDFIVAPILGLVIMPLPVVIVFLLYYSSKPAESLFLSILLFLTYLFYLARVYPNALRSIFRRYFGVIFDYWQGLALVLAITSLVHGGIFFFLVKNEYGFSEILKLAIIFLSAIVVVVPTSVKNLKGLFENTGKDF